MPQMTEKQARHAGQANPAIRKNHARSGFSAVLLRHTVDLGLPMQLIVAAVLRGGAYVSLSTVYAWRSGQLEPSYSQLCALLAHGPRALVDDLLALLAGQAHRTTVPEIELTDADFDLDGDHRVTPNDLVLATARGLGRVQQQSTEEALIAADDRLISPEEQAGLIGRTNEGNRMLQIIRGILQRCVGVSMANRA